MSARFKWILLISFAGFISLFSLLFLQNTTLETNRYPLPVNNLPEKLIGLRIAHVSDVHLTHNWIETDRIITAVRKTKPDFIFLTGDIIDRSAIVEDCDLGLLSSELSQIAPTYAVSGNHETSSGQLKQWQEILIQSGVTVLNNQAVVVEFNHEPLLIAGVANPHSTNKIVLLPEQQGLPTFLLAHRPEKFERYLTDNVNLNPDIVFSGHTHGGQVRLPFVGAIFVPDQKLFPKYSAGIYQESSIINSNDNSEEDTDKSYKTNHLVLNRGIGNSNKSIQFRINSVPEIIIVELTDK